LNSQCADDQLIDDSTGVRFVREGKKLLGRRKSMLNPSGKTIKMKEYELKVFTEIKGSVEWIDNFIKKYLPLSHGRECMETMLKNFEQIAKEVIRQNGVTFK
jgi:hypothetical protein